MQKRQHLRAIAFRTQSGRCYYCTVRMWLRSPSELGLRPRTARPFQCTAEHLVARKDRGRDTRKNIAAACRLCNARRHKRKNPSPPETYRSFVLRRMAKGRWWPESLEGYLDVIPPSAAI